MGLFGGWHDGLPNEGYGAARPKGILFSWDAWNPLWAGEGDSKGSERLYSERFFGRSRVLRWSDQYPNLPRPANPR